jgi:hypothetical protein
VFLHIFTFTKKEVCLALPFSIVFFPIALATHITTAMAAKEEIWRHHGKFVQITIVSRSVVSVKKSAICSVYCAIANNIMIFVLDSL